MAIYIYTSGTENTLKNAYLGADTLPSWYQEVEYIESSGTQYINTWFAYTKTTGKVETKFSSTAFGSQYHTYRLWGSYNSASPTSRSFILYVNYSTLRLWLWTSDGDTSRSLSTNTIYELTEEISTPWTCQVTINGTTTSHNYSGTIATNNNFYIFCNNETGSPGSYGRDKLYYLKLYEEGTLVRNFVPCYRTADDVIWLYDKVNNVFYTNSWTWTFTKWPDVN